MTRTPTTLAIALSTLAAACNTDGSDDEMSEPRFGDPIVLADNTRWTATSAGDPFPDHQPDAILCERAAQSVEGTTLELDTGECNYFLLTTVTFAEVLEGDRISIRAFHDQLAAPEAAAAHLAMSIAGTVIWDQEVSIPAPPTPYWIELDADFDAPVGSPITLHLHNHGFNTYRLLDLRVAAAQ